MPKSDSRQISYLASDEPDAKVRGRRRYEPLRIDELGELRSNTLGPSAGENESGSELPLKA
jgi:hypothetical protein